MFIPEAIVRSSIDPEIHFYSRFINLNPLTFEEHHLDELYTCCPRSYHLN